VGHSPALRQIELEGSRERKHEGGVLSSAQDDFVAGERHAFRRLLHVLVIGTAIAVTGGMSGCAFLGRTRIAQEYYLAVPSGDDINFFRVRVDASTVLGDTAFRSGWYSAIAVDNLYGNVSEKDAVQTYQMREALASQYDAAIKRTTEGYLSAAADPQTKPEVLQSWLLAQRRVRATAGSETPLPQGSTEIEYNPGQGLATMHAGEKLVLVLSSDPGAVVEAINTFSKDVQTGATVMKLADVIRQREANDIAVSEARNEARTRSDGLIGKRIAVLEEFLKTSPNRTELAREVDALRIIVENYR
jgi:hypothetical protein